MIEDLASAALMPQIAWKEYKEEQTCEFCRYLNCNIFYCTRSNSINSIKPYKFSLVMNSQ